MNEFRDIDFLTTLGFEKNTSLRGLGDKVSELTKVEFEAMASKEKEEAYQKKLELISDYMRYLGLNLKLQGERMYLSVFGE